MNVSVKVTGRDALKQRLKQIVGNTQALVSQEVKRATDGCRKEAKDLCPRASGVLRQSIQSRYLEAGKIGEVYTDLKYGKWVEGIYHKGKYGRKPGKWPPLLPILKWILIKKIHEKAYGRKGATLASAKSLAFVIRRKIGKKGTRAQPFLLPAFLHNRLKFKLGCKKILARAAQLAHIEMRRGA